MYADDTAIIYRNKNVTKMGNDMTHDIIILHDWFSVNKLAVNIDKLKLCSLHI